MFGRAAASRLGEAGRQSCWVVRMSVFIAANRVRLSDRGPRSPIAVRQAGRLGLGVKWERRSAVRYGQTRSCALIAAASMPLNCRNVLEQRLFALERSVRDEEAQGRDHAARRDSCDRPALVSVPASALAARLGHAAQGAWLEPGTRSSAQATHSTAPRGDTSMAATPLA